MLPSTPLGSLIAESGLTPAIHLLNYRQSRYGQRLYQNPQNSAGPKEIIEGKSQFAETLRKASQLGKETRIGHVWMMEMWVVLCSCLKDSRRRNRKLERGLELGGVPSRNRKRGIRCRVICNS
jgi:hypothetical protein